MEVEHKGRPHCVPCQKEVGRLYLKVVGSGEGRLVPIQVGFGGRGEVFNTVSLLVDQVAVSVIEATACIRESVLHSLVGVPIHWAWRVEWDHDGLLAMRNVDVSQFFDVTTLNVADHLMENWPDLRDLVTGVD